MKRLFVENILPFIILASLIATIIVCAIFIKEHYKLNNCIPDCAPYHVLKCEETIATCAVEVNRVNCPHLKARASF